MNKISYRERNRRTAANYAEVWEASTRTAEDPGLREHYETLPRFPLTLLSCALGKAVNHGGILRLAEAYRLEKVIYEVEPDRAKEFSGVRGAHVWQPWEWTEKPVDVIRQAKANGVKIYGLSLTPNAVPVQICNWSFPAMLVLGEELKGLRPEVLELCDEIIAIPLYGITISLNVGMAAAIALNSAATAAHQAGILAPVRASSQSLVDQLQSKS